MGYLGAFSGIAFLIVGSSNGSRIPRYRISFRNNRSFVIFIAFFLRIMLPLTIGTFGA